ncbi:MAG: Gmad2 immunoglobulin-like domain-containing protein [Chloroflexota bacterium]
MRIGRTLSVALLVSALALGITACWGGQASPTPTPTATPAATSAVAQATPRPSAATATPLGGLSQAIVLVEPKPQQEVRSPLRLSGHARVYEGTVRFEVADSSGAVLGEGFTTATAGAPEVGYFAAELSFTPPARTTAGFVRIFSTDMRDGKRVSVVEVPVTLATGVATRVPTVAPATAVATTASASATRTLTLKAYFTKSTASDVQFVAVEHSAPYTAQMGTASLQELLKGPSADDKKAGLDTAIPSGVTLKGLRIENGTAYADFDQKLQQGVSGSVRTMSIRRQITMTLQQFSTVQKVVISIDGKTEGILQP